MLPEIFPHMKFTHMKFLLQSTHVPTKHWQQRQIVGFSHGASKVVQEWQSLPQLSFTLELLTALKASNILYAQYRSIFFLIKEVEVTNKFGS